MSAPANDKLLLSLERFANVAMMADRVELAVAIHKVVAAEVARLRATRPRGVS